MILKFELDGFSRKMNRQEVAGLATIAISTATATATATAATAISATATAATTTITATAATGRTFLTRTSFVDSQGTALKLFAVEVRNGSISLSLGAHFNECKTA